VGDICDCAPSDPNLKRPDEVVEVVIEKLPSGVTRLSWMPAAGADDGYAVTRGELPFLAFGEYGACLAPTVAGPFYDDPEDPSAGAGFFYLVQGRSATCGLGSLGFSSADGERVNRDAAACN
jgi:hypothetical protein